MQAKILAIDYETGGLDARICPPLSMAVVAADAQFNELDGFALRIRPPHNTVLAVPVLRDQRNDPELFNPQIDYYLDLRTNERYAVHPPDFCLIQAPAARINGFVRIENDTWDLDTAREWCANSRPVEETERTLRLWARQHFTCAPTPAAHNAQFDLKYCKTWMPGLHGDMLPDWVCTMLWYAKVLGKRKGTKLSDVCVAAGYQQKNAHEALDDTRGCLAALRWLSANHPGLLQAVK